MIVKFLILLPLSAANAMPLALSEACPHGLGAASSLRRASTPPSPLSVNPENEHEMLAFIDALVPLPQIDTVFGLEMTLKKFYALYKPDLTSAEIVARFFPNAPTRMALRAILNDKYKGRRVDIGRMRLWWLAFIADVVPNAPPPDPAVVHRAEAMVVPRRPGTIVAFITENQRIPTVNSVASVSRSITQLYARHLSGLTPPAEDLGTYAKKESDEEIRTRWDAYVDALTAERMVPSPVRSQQLPIIPKFGVRAEQDPAEIILDAGAMLEYLVVRYPKLHPGDTDAVALYLNALRSDLGLGPTSATFQPRAFKRIWHSQAVGVSRLLREEWKAALSARRDRPAR